ncbi:MAG: response regulator [Bacteroidota bacterium]
MVSDTFPSDDRPTVLIVDDDADMRLYLRSCLSGTRVVEAADGVEALHVARAVRPALVLSDVTMPHLDGVALRRALRADPNLWDVPVVLISGHPEAVAPCADGFLTKPFNARDLWAAVHPFLHAQTTMRRMPLPPFRRR